MGGRRQGRGLRANQLSPEIRSRLGLGQPSRAQGAQTPSRRDSDIAKALESLKTCIPSAALTAVGAQFAFPGARLLSLNAIYRLHFTQRHAYASAWHDAVMRACLLGRAESGQRFALGDGPFDITVVRQAPRALDGDNIVPKAVIDGLRHAGVISEDNPKVMRRCVTDNAAGEYAVRVEITKVD